MARQDVAVTSAPGAYAGETTAVTMTAADTTNFEQVAITGREILLIHNTDAGAQTVTITSVNDRFNRTGDITADSIAAGAIHVYGPTALAGWQQSDGNLYFQASATAVEYAVIRY